MKKRPNDYAASLTALARWPIKTRKQCCHILNQRQRLFNYLRTDDHFRQFDALGDKVYRRMAKLDGEKMESYWLSHLSVTRQRVVPASDFSKIGRGR